MGETNLFEYFNFVALSDPHCGCAPFTDAVDGENGCFTKGEGKKAEAAWIDGVA